MNNIRATGGGVWRVGTWTDVQFGWEFTFDWLTADEKNGEETGEDAAKLAGHARTRRAVSAEWVSEWVGPFLLLLFLVL